MNLFKNLKMSSWKVVRTIVIVLLVPLFVVAIVSFLCVVFNKAYFNTSWMIDTKLAADFGTFFGGYVGVLFSVISTLLIVYTIINQFVEQCKRSTTDNFYKMLELHNVMVNQLSVAHVKTSRKERVDGRRAFVVFKIQIKDLLTMINDLNSSEGWRFNQDEQLEIAFLIFYYGIDPQSSMLCRGKIRNKIGSDVLEKILDCVLAKEDIKLGRTNQTSLSAYFQNMYNLIKMVDDDKSLDKSEKKHLIKVFRAQLSAPELYVLFFYFRSSFAKKWKDKKYVEKYKLLKYIPNNYCDGYDPACYYKINYEFVNRSLLIEC